MANLRSRIAGIFRARVAKYDPADIPRAVGLISGTQAGTLIDEHTALSISTVYACVGKIASTIAALDLEVSKRSGRNLNPYTASPAFQLCAVAPNEGTAPFQFWEGIVANACLFGCGYAFIERDKNGRAVALYPIDNNDIQRKTFEDREVYEVRGMGLVSPFNLFKVANIFEASPIKLHRDNIGLARSAQDYGSAFFANGGQMTGILSTDKVLTPEQISQLQNNWNGQTTHAGVKVVPLGLKYSAISVPPEAIQFIETRKLQAAEICRIFNVPPALVQLDSQTTYNNVEQQNAQFRTNLLPWFKRIEQEVLRKLVAPRDRQSVVVQFDTSGFFRADMTTRSEFYRESLAAGWLSINEVRHREGLNPAPGGDQYTVQVNQIALDRLGAYSDKISEPEKQENERE